MLWGHGGGTRYGASRAYVALPSSASRVARDTHRKKVKNVLDIWGYSCRQLRRECPSDTA